MSWLFEDPTYVLVFGAAAEACLLIALIRTGQRMMIVGMLGVLVLVGGLVLVERLVVTDREKVEDTLFGAAAALNNNDAAALVEYISPSAPAMRTEVGAIARNLKVQQAKITSDVEVTFNRLLEPPRANAVFIGRLEATYSGMKIPGVARLRVGLRQEGDRWLMYEYELLQDLGDKGR